VARVYPFAKWSLGLVAMVSGGLAQPAWGLPALGAPAGGEQSGLQQPADEARPALPEAARGALTTDINSEQGMIALGHSGRATPVNQRIDLALVRYDWRVGMLDPRGNLRLGIDFEHGAAMTPDGADFLARSEDHYSFALKRSLYLGARAQVPLRGGVTFTAGAGALREELRDNFATGDALRGRDLVLHGWRMAAGVQKRAWRGLWRAEYSLSRASGMTGGESLRLAGQTRGRLLLGYTARFD